MVKLRSKYGLTFLITVMVLALLGIIIIQYLWIDRTVDEKQRLIREKVYQAVSNVDQKLSDDHLLTVAMDTFFHDGITTYITNEFHEKSDTNWNHGVLFQDNVRRIERDSGSEIRIELNSTIHGEDKWRDSTSYKDTNQISVFRDFKMSMEDSSERMIQFFDGQGEEVPFVNNISNLFARVAVELEDDLGRSRLDSLKVSELLTEEFAENGLEQPTAWKIVDEEEKKTIIQAAEELEWEYDIPIFQQDVLQPGRYHIQINASNNSSLIWTEIRSMVIMSLIFITIIFLAFIFAVRLVVKHKKISQIKSDFINNMTHEFKTPLASISIAADSIVHPTIRNEQKRIDQYVAIIQAEKSKLNDQVERILEVASLDKDVLDIPTEVVLVDEIVQGSIEKLQLLIEDNQVELTFNALGENRILGNEFYLERVFTNLIENSIKYKKNQNNTEPPRIDISISNQEENVQVTITDNGIGMNKKQIEKAFDHFYRVQSGNVHNTKGFGLGLSYAKLITEKLKGSIEMTGVLNEGCTVELKFPSA